MIVLIANEKGGVGKTTVAVNLAAMCTLAGKETLLVDTDKQESSSAWAGVRNENCIQPSLTCVSKTGKIGFDLLSLDKKFEVVVVDSGGRDSVEMRQALAVATVTIIPIRPAQFDLWSLSRMAQLIREIEERTEIKPKAFALINGASPNPVVREALEIREALEDYVGVFPTMRSVVTERIAFRKAAREGKGVLELMSPQSDAKANLELISLYKEIFNEEWSISTPENVTPEQQGQ